MRTNVFRFTFTRSVDMLDAEATLQFAIVAAEGLFGEARTRMDAAYYVDAPRSVIIVDGSAPVGDAIVKMFTLFMIREFGPDAFAIRRVTASNRQDTASKRSASHTGVAA